LDDAIRVAKKPFSLDMAKACHSLIHNLIEAYKLKSDRSVEWILDELLVAFVHYGDE